MAVNFESGFTTTLALAVAPGDTTATLATVPTKTSGRMYLKNGDQREWWNFTGVSGSTITGLTRSLSSTADPATGSTGLTWIAGTEVILVAMHDQLVDKTASNTYTAGTTQSFANVSFNSGAGQMTVPVYATTTTRDAAIVSPTNGMIVYVTADGVLYQYIAGAWTTFATGSVVNMSTTVAGKGEGAVVGELLAGTAAGGTGAPTVATGDVFLSATQLQHGINTVSNYIIGASRSGNAETISLLTKAGTAPSATDPISIAFRNVTAGTGDYTIASVTSALTVTINNTATMGATNNVPFRLWLVAFNSAGTVSLGIVNTQLANGGIFQLNTDSFQSSTTIGTGSDSAGVIYSTAGVSAKAYQILGYLDYTLVAIGVRDTVPTKIQMFGRGVKLPGQTIQVQLSADGAMATGTTVLPYDNTIPQNTEGDQYLSQAITPTAGANKLLIESIVNVASSAAGNNMGAALFQDSTAGALAAMSGALPGAGNMVPIPLSYTMTAVTTSATTFKVRAGGGSAGTTTFNGSAGVVVYGGVIGSYLKITEIMV